MKTKNGCETVENGAHFGRILAPSTDFEFANRDRSPNFKTQPPVEITHPLAKIRQKIRSQWKKLQKTIANRRKPQIQFFSINIDKNQKSQNCIQILQNVAKYVFLLVFIQFVYWCNIIQQKLRKKMFSRKENGLGLLRLLVAPPFKKSKYGTRSSKTRDIDAEDAVS